MPDPIRSLQQLIITNFGLSPSGYTGSRGDVGYVGSAGAGSTGPRITSLTYANGAVAANPAGGETVTVTGSGFNTGANVYLDTLLCTTSYVSSTSLTFTTPAKSVASYMLYVYNTDGSFGVYPVGIIYSSMPVWVTASDALIQSGTNNASYSQIVSATGDGSIAYSVTSGSLPSGLSLNSSTGAITGTTPGTSGTSTFTITATDSQNQTASRSFSIDITGAVSTVEYLVVAGGGGGGQAFGGGGGAGGYRTATGFAVTPGSAITVTVGGGGAGSVPGNSGTTQTGSNSVFGSITSTGGGGGATATANATTGGSGGGGNGNGYAPAAGTVGQGFSGGSAYQIGPYHGGGGGGAGAVGGNATSGSAGVGGIGALSNISGTATYYAGGGGGGASNGQTNNFFGAGGTGGGGAGGAIVGGEAQSGIYGTVNTGSGGGGGSSLTTGYSLTSSGGAGGSGIVIIRYPDSFQAATSTTGSPTITNPTGYRVYTWTTSGSITF